MRQKAQRIRLGVFILISSVFLLLIFGWFTGRRLLEQKETYYVAYTGISVSGLEVGSPVKYLGINVGSIADIRIDPEDVNRIIIRLTLQTDTPVKEDAVADIISVGITGMKALEIRGGTTEADFLEPEEFIEAGSTMAADITGRAEVIAFKVEEVINNLQAFTDPQNMAGFTRAAENIAVLAENSGVTVARIDEIISENRKEFSEAASSINNIAGRMDVTSEDLSAAIGRFNEIMQGDDITEVLSNLREVSLAVREANMKELIDNAAEAALNTQGFLLRMEADFQEGSMHLQENLLLLQHTLENLNEASRKINMNPSVLIRGQSTRNIPDRNLK